MVPVLVLYGNCDGYQSTQESISSSSTCANNASLSLKLLDFNSARDCENLNLVHCDSRQFSPEVDNSAENQVEYCLEDSDFGETCLIVTEYRFNTRGASDLADDYKEGGAYNYQEFNCYMSRFSHKDKPVFSVSKPSLKESLLALKEQCLEGGL